ncbi:hypothetical protein LEP1GSC196_0167 [Leptospira meyeri serovar Semaranga str. Veldrot Semarang 173]|nr:hypothetical protein LEP1GSC196_0167 [Leptospira meyeri serovar Semaranga str. Veldrot Semarang 173]
MLVIYPAPPIEAKILSQRERLERRAGSFLDKIYVTKQSRGARKNKKISFMFHIFLQTKIYFQEI